MQNNTIKTIKDLYQDYPLTAELGAVIGTIVGSQPLINYATSQKTPKGGTPIMWESAKRLEQREQQRIINEAEARGQERLNTLVKFLLRDGRIQDLEKSVSDETYRQELYQEFHL